MSHLHLVRDPVFKIPMNKRSCLYEFSLYISRMDRISLYALVLQLKLLLRLETVFLHAKKHEWFLNELNNTVLKLLQDVKSNRNLSKCRPLDWRRHIYDSFFALFISAVVLIATCHQSSHSILSEICICTAYNIARTISYVFLGRGRN